MEERCDERGEEVRFFRKKKNEDFFVQTAAGRSLSEVLAGESGVSGCERRLYRALREAVPVIDAAIGKIVRLVGSFRVRCSEEAAEQALEEFLKTVKVNACNQGIDSFLGVFLDQLLTYGTAVGEIVPDGSGQIAALYNASLDDVELEAGDHPLDLKFYVWGADGREPVRCPGLILCSTMMNEPGKVYGTSLLRGLSFAGELLRKIFRAIETNWERIGNVRFAVSYKPGESDRGFSKERARQIASEWSKAMQSTEPKDFVTVGDVNIRVIGADNQVPDSDVPVRQVLEQIVAKLSIPPFLLGLSWSSTERMSSQQADILTSELEYYRRCLEGSIRKICGLFLKLNGFSSDFCIEWESINLQDEVELARARLLNAQADAVLQEKEGEKQRDQGTEQQTDG